MIRLIDRMLEIVDFELPRTKTYGRNRRDPAHFRPIPLEHTGNTLEDGSSIPAETFSEFFPMISDRFPQESTGNSQQFIGKKFPPEYCFHFRCFPAGYGDFSAPFLQDTVAGIFVLGSSDKSFATKHNDYLSYNTFLSLSSTCIWLSMIC